LTKSSIRYRYSGGQHSQSLAAETPQDGGLGIIASGVPPDRVVETVRNEEALFGSWSAGKCSAHRCQKFGKAGPHRVSGAGEAKYRCAPSVFGVARRLHEMVGGFNPSWLRHRPGAQKHDPRAPHGCRGSLETDSERLGRACEATASDVGNFRRCVAGPRVGNDNLGQKARRGSRN
jgi:hypothetical protein